MTDATGAVARVPAISLSSIRKGFPGVQALKDVSISIMPGEVRGLVGENGAGKSTLVNILSGALEPDAGRIEVNGRVAKRLDPATAMRLGVSVSHQEIRLAPNLSVAENISFGAIPTRLGAVQMAASRKIAEDALDAIGATVEVRAIVGDLPLASQQLVEIARAVRLAGTLLVLDEPTASLSQHDADALFEAVARVRAQGVAVLYISHRLEEIRAICDRVTVLRDGEKVADLEADAATQGEIVRFMVGRNVADMFPPRAGKPGRPILRTKQLSGPGSPNPIDLEVRAGEIVGVFGLVGAGRSEFVRLIAGVDPVRHGSVHVDGQVMSYFSPAAAMRRGIAFVPEDRKGEGLVLSFTVAENLALPGLKAVAGEYSLSRGGLARFASRQISLLDIRPADPARPAVTLSGGNQQKVAIGKWLTRQPRLLIVDEPTRGVDVGAKAQIYSLLVDLADQGMAVLMVSSELPEVLGLSDRVVVFHGGRISGELHAAAATPEAVMELALGSQFEVAQ